MAKRPSYKKVAKEQMEIINKLVQQVSFMKAILMISSEVFGEETMKAVTAFSQNPTDDSAELIIKNLKEHLTEATSA